MNRRRFLQLSATAAAAATLPRAHAQTTVSGIMQPVLKRAYDLANTGCNLKETTLTVARMKANGIRVLFTLPMEGDARGSEAQPLVVPSVLTVDGNTRDVCITASMNNLVYAFDANSSDILWVKKLGIPIKSTTAIDGWQINDHFGLLSTGVIDPATNILYLVAWVSTDGTTATAKHKFFALNLADGSFAKPAIDLTGTTYQPAFGPLQHYNTTLRKQRSSLTMATIGGKKTVIWACGTIAETSSVASGWLFAYDIASGTYTAITMSDSNYGAGIWMAGSSVSVDSKGSIYLVTGNGSFDGVASFGECAVRIQYAPPGTAKAKLQVVDWWSPWSDAGREGEASAQVRPLQSDETKIAGTNGPTMAMAATAVSNPGYNDQDLGSAPGALIESIGSYFVCGKDGIVYDVNIANMGKTQPGDFANPAANYAKLNQPPEWFTFFPGYGISAAPQNSTALDVLYFNKTHHQHSSPVQYISAIHGQMLFCCGENGSVRAWSVTKTSMTFLAQSNETASPQATGYGGGMTGGFMSLSANGQTPGTAMLYVLLPYNDSNKMVTNGRLVIYDAENFLNGVMQVLWDSQAEGVDFVFDKFCPPVVSGGKVFVPTYADETLVLG